MKVIKVNEVISVGPQSIGLEEKETLGIWGHKERATARQGEGTKGKPTC